MKDILKSPCHCTAHPLLTNPKHQQQQHYVTSPYHNSSPALQQQQQQQQSPSTSSPVSVQQQWITEPVYEELPSGYLQLLFPLINQTQQIRSINHVSHCSGRTRNISFVYDVLIISASFHSLPFNLQNESRLIWMFQLYSSLIFLESNWIASFSFVPVFVVSISKVAFRSSEIFPLLIIFFFY